MGLFKRLVTAVEKIADKKDDYNKISELLNDFAVRNHHLQIAIHKANREEQMYSRYLYLKKKLEKGDKLSLSDLREKEVGDDVFKTREK